MNEAISIEWRKSDATTYKRAQRLSATGVIVDVFRDGSYLGAVWTGRLDALRTHIRAWCI